MIIFILGVNEKVNAAESAEDYVVDLNSQGIITSGTALKTDRPILRPVYQGDYSTIFKDFIGPKGAFLGYIDDDPKNNQVAGMNSVFIAKNVGTYQGRKVALKIGFPHGAIWPIGVNKNGSIKLLNPSRLTYQAVYDEPNYPVIKGIYIDLPLDFSLTAYNNSFKVPGRLNISTSVLKKLYFLDPNTSIARTYEIKNDEFIFSPYSYTSYSPSYSSAIIYDNDQPIVLDFSIGLATSYEALLFNSSIKVPYVPSYLPVRVNELKNSTKFEAIYDVGQPLTDTYATYFPDSVKVVVEDKEGYFKKLDQKTFVFTDKYGKDISNLVSVNKVSNSKLEFSLSRNSLISLGSNIVNIKLSMSELNTAKVLSNFDKEKNEYHVPLTFYNVRNIKGNETKSEETKANATIIPNIYGEANPAEVFVGTSTNDLNPLDLIKNGLTTIPGDTLKVIFTETQMFTEAKVYNVSVKLSSTLTPGITKTITVPVTAKKGTPITSAFFENQSWIIDEINRQLAPKKIDKDVYKEDLSRITTINVSSSAKYPTEHIPFTIGQLTNLTSLTVANLNLVGSLPEELGDLSKLTKLAIYGNQFTSGIPESLGKLTHLKILSLYNNNLTGTVPRSIGLLPELKQISLNDNQLIGQLPDFHLNMELIALNNNQLTYNKSILPTFLTSAKLKAYDNTFIEGLLLTANAKVSSKVNEIKPFNISDSGYFNLKAIQGMNVQNLYENHTYTIKDAKTGIVYYTGKKDIQAKIPYSKGILYQVILDEAEENNNNIFYIQGKEDEFRFAETPVSLSIKSKRGNKIQPVVFDGKLAIFDNRENKNWKISITPSVLTQGQRQLKGEYSYTSIDGQNHPIINGQKFLLETGKSDSVNKIIPISDIWNDKYGLKYLTYKSNYIGNYRGTVEWTLENAP